jgi:hypothetical protein
MNLIEMKLYKQKRSEIKKKQNLEEISISEKLRTQNLNVKDEFSNSEILNILSTKIINLKDELYEQCKPD